MIPVAAFHRGQVLAEVDLQAPEWSCPFCGSSDREPYLVLQPDPLVELLRCRTCQAASASRMPRQSALDRFYAGYYASEGTAVTADDPARLARRIARYADAAGRRPDASFRILDFGGGDGAISVAVATARPGWSPVEIHVVDYDPGRVTDAPPGIRVTSAADLPDENDPFDLVIASAVLEHLPEPAPVLDRLLSLVGPNGVFYARTPWVAPTIKAAARAGLTIDFTFPAHLHDLGGPFWTRVTERFPHHAGHFALMASRTSPVETGLRDHAGRTIAAFVLKAPSRLLGERWPFVGGWEVALRRIG